MESLKELYRFGPGPSSSHTIGPKRALLKFIEKYPNATSYGVILYGSLALTGKGHLTDYILQKTSSPKMCKVTFDIKSEVEHPNTMDLIAYENDLEMARLRAFSLGGGRIAFQDEKVSETVDVFPFNSMKEIKEELIKRNIDLPTLVYQYDCGIKSYLSEVLDRMFECVERGLNATGIIPGKLKLEKVAKDLYLEALNLDVSEKNSSERTKLLVTSYAYAVSEENASGGEIVTAPTCGASGVVPAILYYFYKHQGVKKDKLIDALAVGGVFGNLVKTNASISGAVGGCQAEIGTACSMAASMAAYIFDLNIHQIEYASEVAMEHHLGLTCDPVLGYVQIPCIERNGVAALRAYDAAIYGRYISKYRRNRVSFDDVIEVMKETGDHLKQDYKETSLGGLAKKYLEKGR